MSNSDRARPWYWDLAKRFLDGETIAQAEKRTGVMWPGTVETALREQLREHTWQETNRCPFIDGHDEHEGMCPRSVEKPGENLICLCVQPTEQPSLLDPGMPFKKGDRVRHKLDEGARHKLGTGIVTDASRTHVDTEWDDGVCETFGACTLELAEPLPSDVSPRWVVVWDPPINKGSVALLYTDPALAQEGLEAHSDPVMNARIARVLEYVPVPTANPKAEDPIRSHLRWIIDPANRAIYTTPEDVFNQIIGGLGWNADGSQAKSLSLLPASAVPICDDEAGECALVGMDDCPAGIVMKSEIDRLRSVIRIGGAMYRAERARMGIAGGHDPNQQMADDGYIDALDDAIEAVERNRDVEPLVALRRLRDNSRKIRTPQGKDGK